MIDDAAVRRTEAFFAAFIQAGMNAAKAQTLPSPEDILTPDQAAAVLAIPKKTVIALCAQGRLTGAFKAGRRWRIPGRAVRSMAGQK